MRLIIINMDLFPRNPAIGVCDLVIFILAYSATETIGS